MTRIAELQDRLRRLAKRREGEGIYTDAAICEEAAEALSRTGAVKVKALVDSLLDLRDLIMRGKRCVTDTGPAVKPVIELAAVHILDDAANALEALSALEPAAPEGRQEIVARPSGKSDDEYRTDYEIGLDDGVALACSAEQAVIDKVLDAAGDYMSMQYGNTALYHPTDRARIKAAMEAGRHD